MDFCIQEQKDAVAFLILVQPRSSRSKIGPIQGDRLKVSITAPPVDGAANKAVIQLFSKALGCSKSSIEITHGKSSRKKRIQIQGIVKKQLEGLI